MSQNSSFNAYQTAAKKLSNRYGPQQDSLDSYARSKEDLAQELILETDNIVEKFRKVFSDSGPASETKYVHKSLYYRSLDYKRSSERRRKRAYRYESLETPLEFCGDEDFYIRRLDAKNKLKRLIPNFKERELELLIRVAESAGSIMSSWEPSEDGSYTMFRRKIIKLREQAYSVVGD